jgi:hypothetical protein
MNFRKINSMLRKTIPCVLGEYELFHWKVMFSDGSSKSPGSDTDSMAQCTAHTV